MKPIVLALLAITLLRGAAHAQAGVLPKLKATPLRYYPTNAMGVAASVVLTFIVLPDGSVDASTISVLRSTDSRFEEAARLTALALEFEPARWKAEPVKMLVQQEITFDSRTQPCATVVTASTWPQCVDSASVLGHP